MASVREDVKKVLIEMEIDSVTDVSAAFERFKHTGFDAIAVMKKLRSKSGNPAALKSDMIEILTLVKLRGTKVLATSGSAKEKWNQKTSEAGKSKLSELAAKYGIAARAEGDKVTLSQIVATFPNLTAQVLAAHDFGNQVGLGELKPYYAFPHAPAIIPSSDTDQIEAWKRWAHDFDRLINSKKPNHVSRVDEFFPIIHGSPIFSDDSRMKVAEKCESLLSGRG